VLAGYAKTGTGNAKKFLLFFQGKRIGKKKKTSVKSCNLNPYWNESFVFLIDEMDMKRVYLDVTVCI
jgi:Ca2+-dependent lipid-binding protein